jgi:hypothetical protein
MTRKFLATLAMFALAGGLALPAVAADIPDEQWVKSAPPQAGGSWGINLAEDIGSEGPIGYMLSFKSDTYVSGSGKNLAIKICSSFGSEDCPRSEYQNYRTPVSMCKNNLDFDCVADLVITKEDGTKLNYKSVTNFPATNKFAFVGNKSAKLPNSGSTFLVDIPDAPHPGGTLYYVAAVLTGERYPSQEQFTTRSFNVQIRAVSLESGSFSSVEPVLDLKASPTFPNFIQSGNSNCNVQCSDTQRALGQPMPLNLKFGVQLRLNAKVSGWLNGRVSRVQATISSDTDGMQLISVAGNPVQVPVIFGWVTKAAAPDSIKNFYNSLPRQRVGGNGYGPCLDPEKSASSDPAACNPIYWESTLRLPGKSEEDLKEVALWLPVLNDSAVAAPTRWSIGSTDSDFINGCSASSTRLTGIVTTNASGYVSGPPTFNKAEQALEYKVLAPHKLKDGKVFQGTYDLAIESAFARCIYGFTNAPVSATVSVIANDGSSQVATVATGEKDGWIYLGAYGFTFSSPTLRVKLSQAAAVPTPTPVATKPAAAKKTTITCVKGKTSKKVIAVNPKCPTGYKKK